MTHKEIEHITFWLMIKWAIIFYIFIIPFRYWAQEKALKKLKALLKEGEEIIYKPKFDYSIEIILPLAVGGFWGAVSFNSRCRRNERCDKESRRVG